MMAQLALRSHFHWTSSPLLRAICLCGSLILVSSCATLPQSQAVSHPERTIYSSFDPDDASKSASPPVVLKSGAETARYSYATGCLQAYQRICQKLLTDEEKGACRDDGLSVCEGYALKFGNWIRAGKSNAQNPQ
jgi:hypothetical protein